MALLFPGPLAVSCLSPCPFSYGGYPFYFKLDDARFCCKLEVKAYNNHLASLPLFFKLCLNIKIYGSSPAFNVQLNPYNTRGFNFNRNVRNVKRWANSRFLTLNAILNGASTTSLIKPHLGQIFAFCV